MMHIKSKLSWSFLSSAVLLLILSCQNSNQISNNSLSESENLNPQVDTDLWLSETRGIRDILEDSKGNLWFSSADYVAKFDGKSIQYFSEENGLANFGNLHLDDNGTIWVEDGFKISRYNGNRFVQDDLDSNTVANNLWVQKGVSPTDTTFVEPGIYYINSKEARFFPYPIEKYVTNKYLYFPTTKAYYGKDSTVWVGTMEKVFGLINDSIISIGREEMGRNNDERQVGIRGIFVDSEGKLWIADNGAGIFVYDGDKIQNFTRKHDLDEGDTKGSTLHRAFSIAEDDKGNMWFGTVYSGIWMYNPKTKLLKNYTKDEGVASDNIWTIYKTKKGDLLFAGESPAAVYRFNGNSFDRKY